MKKLKSISRRTWTLLSVILVLTGVVMYMYPRIANRISQEYTVTAISSFKTEVKSRKEEDRTRSVKQQKTFQETSAEMSMEKESTLDTLLEKAKEYNEKLYAEGQKDLIDPFSYEVSSIDLSEYGIENNMFGYIEVPKLDIILGIYLGATSENMSKGAVHLTQTSLPIGGNNTNAVIAAHRGSRYGEMFQYIDKLETGDEINIGNAWETLSYSVTSIVILAPDEIDKVLIQKGRDMITLISCNPYGKNIQRYVVYCDRIAPD